MNWDEGIERIIAANKKITHYQFEIGDITLALVPNQSMNNRAGGRWMEAGVGKMMEKISRETGVSKGSLKSFRITCVSWPKEKRLDLPWTYMRNFNSVSDRFRILSGWASSPKAERVSINDLTIQYTGHDFTARSKKARQKINSFSNISKAVFAAIEVLQDDSLSDKQKVRHALNILVRYFENHQEVA